MPEVKWLGTAYEDLLDIKAFYEELEVGLGSRLAQEILEVEHVLQNTPRVGQVVKNLAPEHRQLRRGHHLIIYRLDGDLVKIAAVIDSRRNFLAAWRSKKR